MIRRLATSLVLVLAACAAPQVAEVTVSRPKVWGDDTVFRGLAERAQSMRALAAATPAPRLPQEQLAVRVDQADRLAFGANVADPETASALPEAPALPVDRDLTVRVRAEPLPGLTWNESFRQLVDRGELVRGYEALFAGDAALLDRRARCVLLRFDVCFTNYLDLGERRRFVVVGFVIRGKGKPAPRFDVYLLSPEYSAFASQEALTQTTVDQLALQLLGTWGGTGVAGGWGTTSAVRERLEAVLETPLQFGIPGPRTEDGEAAATFAFAFGPRRRLVERSPFNPARWFGSPWEMAYELQPGPRPCQALLVFPDLREPPELVVTVLCDGALVAEEEVSLAQALGRRRVGAFNVKAPAHTDDDGVATGVLDLAPEVGADLVVASGCGGPAFSALSEVLVGPCLVRDVRPLGRGRLLVRVRPLAALVAARGGEVEARVVTPDQADFVFRVRLKGAR